MQPTIFLSKLKTVHLHCFWPKTVYLKCFGIQLKNMYLQGPRSLRPCIWRPCCTCLKFWIFFLQKGKLWESCKLGDSGAVKKLFSNMTYIDVAPMKVEKRDIFDIVASVKSSVDPSAELEMVKNARIFENQ